MKVLKQGKISIKINWIVNCWNCNSELEYESNDIKLSTVNKGYIICPVCETCIPHLTPETNKCSFYDRGKNLEPCPQHCGSELCKKG